MTAPARLSDLTVAPTLETDRLRLRMPALPDFEYWSAFFATERSVWEDGPLDRHAAWNVWAATVALWPLRGIGPFAVETRAEGRYLGEVGFYWPAGYPELEFGWFVVPEAEGAGIAREAALTAMTWGREAIGLDHVVNYIAPGNDRSIALGERLGGTRRTDLPVKDEGDVVIWHDLTRLDRGIAS